MIEFIGTLIALGAIGIGSYHAGKLSMTDTLRYWKQRATTAEKIADDMGRAAMENYVDLAVAELRTRR